MKLAFSKWIAALICPRVLLDHLIETAIVCNRWRAYRAELSIAGYKPFQDFVARNSLLFEDLVAFVYALAISRRWAGIAIENPGVELASVCAGQFGGAGSIGRIVPD